MLNKKTIVFSDIDAGKCLKTALKMKQDEIINEIKISGLRGRGGAGFPTGLKWELTKKAKSEKKFVICNADEGEPGTFKDRLLLMDYPKKIIEAMTIAAFAIGNCSLGFIYLRNEYIYLKKGLIKAIEELKAENLLGKKILGTDFSFDIEIRLGAGAYVCGEETALIDSMQGHRGEAKNKPPFPVTNGYLDKPTIVNNVETLSVIPYIIINGGSVYKQTGTDKSTGTKLFSVSGDTPRPGVYEFEMGITVKELLKRVDVKDAKAVQIGGASGICVGEKDFDKKIAFEELPPGGSIIIFNRDRDMLKVLKNFMEFFMEESCGQCTPCREGNYRLVEAIHHMEKGECSISKLNNLIDLAKSMKISSKCGLGQSSPNSFLSIIATFEDEIVARERIL